MSDATPRSGWTDRVRWLAILDEGMQRANMRTLWAREAFDACTSGVQLALRPWLATIRADVMSCVCDRLDCDSVSVPLAGSHRVLAHSWTSAGCTLDPEHYLHMQGCTSVEVTQELDATGPDANAAMRAEVRHRYRSGQAMVMTLAIAPSKSPCSTAVEMFAEPILVADQFQLTRDTS